jgi:hypothetical protein
MTRRTRRPLSAATAPAALLLAALAVAGCATTPPLSATDQAISDSCHQHADVVYNNENPGAAYRSDIFQSNSQNSNFGVTGKSGVPTAGLSQSYEHNQLVNDCLTGNGLDKQAPMSRDMSTNGM